MRESERVARRKLLQIHAATELASLRIPPGNQLEALKGDRLGQHSIRINPNGACALLGMTMVATVWKSWTTTEYSGARHMTTELLDEIHPGEILL